MIGMPYLNPHFPRSILVEKKNLNFLKKFMNYFLD